MKRSIMAAALLLAVETVCAQEKAKDSLICDETHMVWMKNSIKVKTENDSIYARLVREERAFIYRIEIDMDYSQPRYVVVFRQRYEDELFDFFNRLAANPVYPKKK